VLEFAAEKAGWGNTLSKGRGRGIAMHEIVGSFFAHVIEASVPKEGRCECIASLGRGLRPS